jgi:hypothetical protein
MAAYYGDILVGELLNIPVNTRDTDGAPATITGSPTVRVYRDDGTTEDDSGITFNVDFDGKTGLHLVEIDTSADGTFYAAGADYQVVLTAGAVDSVSVVGVCVGSFSIENRNTKANMVQIAGQSVAAGGTVTFPTDPADQSLIIAATNTILADTNAILADTDSLDTTKITTARAAVLSDLIDGGRLDLLVDAILARLPTRLTKNTAFSAFMFKMVDATDHVTAETGLTITATRSLDGAAFASCANSATEVSGGWYKIDLAAGDVNGNMVVLRFAGTGADTREVAIVTQP